LVREIERGDFQWETRNFDKKFVEFNAGGFEVEGIEGVEVGESFEDTVY
jgi:hypothetical protein